MAKPQKMKTHRSAVKRFKVTARGKLLRKRAYHSHLLGPKRPDRKRRLAETAQVDPRDATRMLRMLGMA